MIDWQQQRSPEDVPTPVAVALADYCRRTKMPSTPKSVRAALAHISFEQDALLRALTDGDLVHLGWGPMAVVDHILGTDVAEVTQRQEQCYYDLLKITPKRREMLAQIENPVNFDTLIKDRVSEKAIEKKTKKQSIAEKIRPKKRDRFEPEPIEAVAVPARNTLNTLSGATFLPKRNLPLPRGRFTVVDPGKLSVDTLMKPEAKPMIEVLVEQSLHREELFRTLETGYSGKKGKPLVTDDLMLVLNKHHLKETLEAKERAMILNGIIEHRGALGRVAKDKNLSGNALKQLVTTLKLKREVEEAKERFSREALSNGNLSVRLDLLFKTAYLNDLEIELKFKDRLTTELKSLVEEVLPDVKNVKDLVAALAHKHGLDKELLLKGLEKLQLTSML